MMIFALWHVLLKICLIDRFVVTMHFLSIHVPNMQTTMNFFSHLIVAYESKITCIVTPNLNISSMHLAGPSLHCSSCYFFIFVEI